MNDFNEFSIANFETNSQKQSHNGQGGCEISIEVCGDDAKSEKRIRKNLGAGLRKFSGARPERNRQTARSVHGLTSSRCLDSQQRR